MSRVATTTIPHIVQECIAKKIPVSLVDHQGMLGFQIHGFYKSGTLTLVETDRGFRAYQRYNEVDEVKEFDDLVRLNYYWLDFSKGKSAAWEQPDPVWAPELERLGYVKRKVSESWVIA